MHRTRHSSLDVVDSSTAASQEEWSEFLSTSMMALSTADPDASLPPPSLGIPPPKRPCPVQHPLRDTRISRRAAKPRGMSMNEVLSPPLPLSVDAWRPLGRRVASPPPTRTRSSSSSSSSETQTGPPDQVLDAQLPTAFGHLEDSSSLDENTGNVTARELKHVASFRGVVSSCLSSSGSSLYDSSSSDDDQQQQQEGLASSTTHLLSGSVPAPPPPVDPSYAESCLPVLSQLPHPPRSISVDSGNGALASSLLHVKSPVLGSRKDSQTWQLQDEEFLMTSPRFEASLSNRDGEQVDLFCEKSVGSLLSTEAGDQYDAKYRGHPRLAKDSRASSVDFTLGRRDEVSPPLPPPQEPYQRLRARSFSYSATYGASMHDPFSKHQFTSMPLHQQHPQSMMGPDLPHTLRSFHSGSGMMQPGQPQLQPPPAGVRPPRGNIRTDSSMRQYQYGPPMPYRRYSDAFAMPTYPDSYPGDQQENHHSRQGNAGRVMRSYSMEYGSYPSARQVRSQSMEGVQLFASAPPMEYSPSLSRSNSAGVVFDWSRGNMDTAPPLPPDVRPLGSNGASHFPSPPPEAYYDVEFKRGRQEVFAGRAAYKPGDYVKVEADRGEDIGRIVRRVTDVSKGFPVNEPGSSGEECTGRNKRHDLSTKKIMCVASQRELEVLNEQRKEEYEVFEVCRSKVRQRLLPMNVIDAEYQFDRHKLTFFFEADRRIDFRELVRDLFAIYKTRIWLQQVIPSGKKPGCESDTR
uniref:PSP1 C-terminal domain-containing protein n=1 Tax=Peronospora matthiolae TaxID=2874970 RepID=A0AAV1TJQ4_9STRA